MTIILQKWSYFHNIGCILIKISMIFPKAPIGNDTVFVKIMAWLRKTGKPLSEQMMATCMRLSVHMRDRKLYCTIPNSHTIHTYIHTDRQTDRHTDRQTHRQGSRLNYQLLFTEHRDNYISTKVGLMHISLYHLSCFGKDAEISQMGFRGLHTLAEGDNISHLTENFVLRIK